MATRRSHRRHRSSKPSPNQARYRAVKLAKRPWPAVLSPADAYAADPAGYQAALQRMQQEADLKAELAEQYRLYHPLPAWCRQQEQT